MKVELTKAFKSWEFVITILIMSIISIGSAMYAFHYSYSDASYGITNPMLGVTSVYTKWIGNDWNSWFSALYFFAFPLVAVMPSGLSLYKERKSNYIAQMVIRERRNIYYFHKYVSAFVSGGTIICLPIILNIAIVALKFPFRTPDLNYDVYYKIQPFSFGSAFFYKSPFLYLLLRVAIVFIYGGLCAMLSISISFISKNRYVILFTPIILFMVVNFSNNVLRIPYEMSPIRFLGAGNTYIVSTYVVIGEAAILLIASLIIYLFGSKKDVL